MVYTYLCMVYMYIWDIYMVYIYIYIYIYIHIPYRWPPGILAHLSCNPAYPGVCSQSIRRPIVNHQSALHPSSIHYPPRSTHQRFVQAAHHLSITHPPSIQALMMKFASCLGCKHPPTNYMTMIAQRWDNRKTCGDDTRNAFETCSSMLEC